MAHLRAVDGGGARNRRPVARTGRRRALARFWPALLLCPALAVLGFFFFAMAAMVQASFAPMAGPGIVGDGFTLDSYWRFLGSWFYLGYLGRSIWIATYCTTITAVLGYAIAYFMYRSGRTVRIVVGTVLIVQFFTAYVIRTYGVMLVIGRTGLLNQTLLGLGLIDRPLGILFTETGVAIGIVLVSLPFMVFPILASLQTIPGNLETAARSLGANDTRAFWEIIFPLSMPGLAAGVVIVFLFQMTSYIIPGILGGGYVDMIANLIYSKALNSFETSFAAAIAVVMLCISGVSIYLLQKIFHAVTPRQ